MLSHSANSTWHNHRPPVCIAERGIKAENPYARRPPFVSTIVASLHHNAASSTLLRCVRIVLLINRAPDWRYHEVLRAVGVRDDAMARIRICLTFKHQLWQWTYLLAAWETGIRSRSKSSLRRLFNSVRRRNLRSAIDCLFFLTWEGSDASRDEYWGIVLCWTCLLEAVDSWRTAATLCQRQFKLAREGWLNVLWLWLASIELLFKTLRSVSEEDAFKVLMEMFSASYERGSHLGSVLV